MDSARAAVRPLEKAAVVASGSRRISDPAEGGSHADDRRLDRRETSDVGRHARLELVFAVRRGRTVLADAYAEPPFRVGRSFSEGTGLHMILVSSAPGIFGGDCLEQVIRVECGARVRLTSQSALQIHPPPRNVSPPLRRDASASAPLRRDHSELLSTYHVEDGASLHCHWDPMIPFAGSRFDQRIEIALARDASLYWSDAWMAGREGRGERWEFDSLAHEIRITREGILEYLERYRITPEEGRVTHPWVGGDACYFGTTLVSGPPIAAEEVERLHTELALVEGVQAAVDALDARVMAARLMSASGVPFRAARSHVRAMTCRCDGRDASTSERPPTIIAPKGEVE